MAATTDLLTRVPIRPAAELHEIVRRLPVKQWQYVDVTFSSTANGDTDIRHSLTPATPEDIDYQVVDWRLTADPTTVPFIYRDRSGDRRAWGTGYLILRCNVASTAVTLLLTVRS